MMRATRYALVAASFVLAVWGLHWALSGLKLGTLHEQILAIDWRWMVIGLLFNVVSYGVQGLRWRMLLKPVGRLSAWKTTRAIYASLFVNEMIPLRPGEVVRAWIAARELNLPTWDVVPSIVTERLLDGLALAVLLLAELWTAPVPEPVLNAARMLIGFIAVVAALAALAAVSGSAKLAWVEKVLLAMRNGRAVAASFAFLGAQALAFWCVLRAVHLPLGVLAGLVVMLVVRLGTVIPGAPANLGTHQMSTVWGLSLFGVPHLLASALSVVVFAALTIPLWLLGAVALASAGLTFRDLPSVTRRPKPAAIKANDAGDAIESFSSL